MYDCSGPIAKCSKEKKSEGEGFIAGVDAQIPVYLLLTYALQPAV
jgi:hypothetical protein